MSRFAPVTSELLARKGDATPSALTVKPSLLWARPPVAPPPAAIPVQAPVPAPPPETAKPHKMMVALNAAEYEKLGIAAVKKGVTRHQIVRTALDLHLERLKREYGGCGCMGGGPCTPGCGTG